MTTHDVEELIRNRLGLRLGTAMAQYVLDQFKAAGVPTIPVIAADARTGTPIRTTFDLTTLSADMSNTQTIVADSTLSTRHS